MRPAPRRFTEAEDGYLRAHYRSSSAGDIARHLDRGIHQVRKRAGKLGIAVPIKGWSEAEDGIIRAAWGKRMLADVARELGRCNATVSERAKRLGCHPWRRRKGTHGGRPVDGFHKGKALYSHRGVVERRLGRSLRSDEIVHHIDSDKFNNADSNLYLFKSRAAHRRAHSSFESIVPRLLELGIVEFDRRRGVYRLCGTHK